MDISLNLKWPYTSEEEANSHSSDLSISDSISISTSDIMVTPWSSNKPSISLNHLINADKIDLDVKRLSSDTLILEPEYYDCRFVLVKSDKK